MLKGALEGAQAILQAELGTNVCVIKADVVAFAVRVHDGVHQVVVSHVLELLL